MAGLDLFLYILAALGVLVPLGTILLYLDLRRRIKRMPAATQLENAWEQLDCALEEREKLEEKCRQLAEEVAKRDVAAEQAEIYQAQVEQARQDLAELEPALKEKQALDEEILEKQERLGSLIEQAEQSKSEAEIAQKAQKDAEEKKSDAEQQLKKIQQSSGEAEKKLEELQNETRELTAKKAQLEAELESAERRLQSATQDQQAVSQQLEQAKTELAANTQRLNELSHQSGELEQQNLILEGRLDAQTQVDEKEEVKAAQRIAELTVAPACLKVDRLMEPLPEMDEIEALNRLEEYLEETGLVFPQRIIYAFHTSLKTASMSPLTVLAGISGTGKSELPRRYAEGMGFHFLPIPVQPRWDGPQDLLGFYNYLESRYKATDLARALVHMDQHNWKKYATPYKGHMLVVLLDEMNLARVEYYFSNFLSSLEVRRGIDPDDEASRRTAETELEIGQVGSNEEINNRLFVGENVFFVGTMNEDETTQALSDKVIDRSNVLRFPKPNFLADSEPRDAQRPEGHLEESTWESWHQDEPTDKDQLKDWIDKLNKTLAGLGRPFGHRVNQAMLSYAANYPSADGANTTSDAFADQLEQRILPKLRGVETEGREEHLDQMESLLEEVEDLKLLEAFRRDREESEKNMQFVWKGVSREEEEENN